jgi:hypothetical protein
MDAPPAAAWPYAFRRFSAVAALDLSVFSSGPGRGPWTCPPFMELRGRPPRALKGLSAQGLSREQEPEGI